MSAKRISQSDIIGEQGIALIQKIVLEIGFLWHPTGGVEAGIDGFIELRDPDTGDMLGPVIAVQSKATARPFQAETPDTFEYVCSEKDLQYWLSGNLPIILVVSRPTTGEVYWISLKHYFSDLERRKARKIQFDKREHTLSQSNAADLLKLGVPSSMGVYLAPMPKPERLYSNLLMVSHFGDQLYIAETDYHTAKDVRAALNTLGGEAGGAWISKSKRIMSFHDLGEFPWHQVCDRGTLEIFDTDEWAYSEDSDRRRDFVQLLNRCLRNKAWTLYLGYDEKRECYFFKPTKDLSSRTVRYQSVVMSTSRCVFQGYPSKRDQSKMAYYRHSAFEGKFRLHDQSWYLEITPTYYFTADGFRPSSYYAENLKGIKQLEKNEAVLGQVVMWANYLSKPDLFTPDYAYLKFGDLMSFDVEFGIGDGLWLGREDDEIVEAAELPLDDLPMFKP